MKYDTRKPKTGVANTLKGCGEIGAGRLPVADNICDHDVVGVKKIEK